MRAGEMYELSRCIRRDGQSPYFCGGQLHLTAEMTKDREPRDVLIPENVQLWLDTYPPTPDSVCPGDYCDPDLSSIREKFVIGHDALRHTAISAFMSAGGNYAEAADNFGNSEAIIRKHYLRRMSEEEAKQFYSITPSRVAHT